MTDKTPQEEAKQHLEVLKDVADYMVVMHMEHHESWDDDDILAALAYFAANPNVVAVRDGENVMALTPLETKLINDLRNANSQGADQR